MQNNLREDMNFSKLLGMRSDTMKRTKIGDVFEIDTPKGKGYFQYVYSDKKMGELIRILPGLYSHTPEEMSSITAEKEMYFVHFPLNAAYKQGIVRLVGNFALPEELEIPRKMRDDFVDRNGNRICWHIVDYETWKRESVKELTDEQKRLSQWGIWNDTLLIQRMAEGWTPQQWT